ncbi:hypothetical protein ACJ41O_010906 [Fusarium nematophilum]
MSLPLSLSGFSFLGIIAALVYLGINISSRLIGQKSHRRESKAELSSPKGSSPKDSYSDVFPPSQRRNLARLDPRFSSDGVDPLALSRLVLGLEEDYAHASPEMIVYSGFRVGEIPQLGNFPNYADLSGVPLPTPVPDFDIKSAQPRPYRPFRWPYHQTMAIQKMEPDFWIELDNTYQEQVRERREIYAEHGKDILQALPGSELACKELMEMAIQFLCARYPSHFALKHNMFENQILGTTYDVLETDPLLLLLENVPEDFAIMLRDPESGRYYFRAGVICASTGWSLGTKIGLGLPEIHQPVPDYREKMQLSMDRFFTKMPADKPVQRGAWGFEIGRHLYAPPGHSSLDARATQDTSLRLKDIFFRVDWQTLRRLPLSGAIVFNFKAFFTPISKLRDEPYVPSLALKVISESKEHLLRYKCTWHIEHVLKPALAEYERYQVEKGMVEKDWRHQTLPEQPFFPGWEEQWEIERNMKPVRTEDVVKSGILI